MKSLLVAALLFGSSYSAYAIKVGDIAPAFEAQNQDGKLVKLKDLHGKYVLLYFYPKDDTPGCTKQACKIRDNYSQYRDRGVMVFGVSRQSAESHQAFRKKHKLPFDLLIDGDGKLAESFGISMIPLLGLHKRQSVLIAPSGQVAAFIENVDPDTHSDEILKKVAR